MQRDKLLAELGRSPQGRALREFLDEQMREIGDVDNCKTEAEMIGAQRAKKLVKKLFSFMDAKKPGKSKKTNYA